MTKIFLPAPMPKTGEIAPSSVNMQPAGAASNGTITRLFITQEMNEMCLAVPMKVTKIAKNKAFAEFGGIGREIDTQLVENVRKGDYLIVHAGFAITKLDAAEAEEKLKLLGGLKK